MDRLLCGDVGYGKTEVALRAAFKAVMDGKQVAILVPTTILAYQHFQTFRERMSEFPVNVEMLSRFRSPKEQKKVINKLSEGETDIVIAKNYLNTRELDMLNRIVAMYLDYAEMQAKKGIIMYMKNES